MARTGPEVGRDCDSQDSRVNPWVGDPEKTLHGAPAGSVFLDSDQERAFSRPDHRFCHRRTEVGFGAMNAVTPYRRQH